VSWNWSQVVTPTNFGRHLSSSWLNWCIIVHRQMADGAALALWSRNIFEFYFVIWCILQWILATNSKALSTLSQKSETVTQKWDCLTKVKLSHFCETVSLFCDSVDRPWYQYINSPTGAKMAAVARVHDLVWTLDSWNIMKLPVTNNTKWE